MPDSNTAQQARQAAASVAEDASSHARDVAQSVRSEARSVTRDAREQATDVLQSARSELRAQASEQAKNLSATLEDFGRQLGDMAGGGGDPESQMAQLARSAADTLSQRARSLEEQGIDGVLDDVKRFARNRPGAFLVSSLAVGFAIGRLAKHADLREIADHAKNELQPDPSATNGSSDRPDNGSASPSPAPAGLQGDALPSPDVFDEAVPIIPPGLGDQPTVSEVVRP